MSTTMNTTMKVSRCDSPTKTSAADAAKANRHSRITATVVRRRSLKRNDLDMNLQLAQVKAEKEHQRQLWLQKIHPIDTAEFQTQSIKYAVAESILFHHKKGSKVLCSMLDGEADKKGTNGDLETKKPATCCGLPKHYLNVLMDDIELISRLDGSQAALTSIRALPLWQVAPKQQI